MIVSDGDTMGSDDWTTTLGIIVVNDADQELIPTALADGNGIVTTMLNEICTTGTERKRTGLALAIDFVWLHGPVWLVFSQCTASPK
jgi:hypothetical protein